MKNSAHQFYYRPTKDELYLLNGYPWGEVKAREQFMALGGLTLGVGKKDAFEEIVDTAIPTIRNLWRGNLLPDFEGYRRCRCAFMGDTCP